MQKTIAIVVLVVIVAGAFLFLSGHAPSPGGYSTNQQTTATSGQGAGNQSFTVKVAYNATVGNYMTNGTGWTLYIYTNDVPNSGKSTCYGSCATYRPPVYATNSFNTLNGINATDFNRITRTDNTIQLTYDGYPLYYYAGDKQAGEIKGQGVGGNWFVVTVPVLNTHS